MITRRGVAIDLDTRRMRTWLDDHGRPLGWAKVWSDAPGEWWHIRYRAGVWDRRPDPGPRRATQRLAEGSGGPCQAPWVERLQEMLREHGAGGSPPASPAPSHRRGGLRLGSE